jgi:hypothetical protein
MRMLRQWNGESLKPIQEMFEQFGLEGTDLSLLKYEYLTPDSFIWLLSSRNGRYCLYAEDFVPSLEHVHNAMKKYGILSDESDKFELLKVKKPGKWDESSPVTASDVYTPPKNPKEFMKYAASSGLDFVFLGKSMND